MDRQVIISILAQRIQDDAYNINGLTLDKVPEPYREDVGKLLDAQDITAEEDDKE